MAIKTKIIPCLWFDDRAEEAAKFYTSIFKGGKIKKTTHYMEAGREIHGHAAGAVMTVEFQIAGQNFTALNGGPMFKFTEAISLQVMCETQKEIDYFWSKLSEGGEPGPCGWLKDKFGLSWQVTPTMMGKLFSGKDVKKAGRAMQAMLKMKKLDIAELKRAAAGK